MGRTECLKASVQYGDWHGTAAADNSDPMAVSVDRYLEKVLPSKPKNARNVRQHLLWWKQELGHCLLSDIKPSRKPARACTSSPSCK